MKITETSNGDFIISGFRKKGPFNPDDKELVLRAVKLIEQMDYKGEGYFTSNAYILGSLLSVAIEEEKGNGMGEIRLLRNVFFCARNRISHILGKYREKRKALAKPDTPELIPCPRCGAPAVLKYRGYLPEYFCSDEKCGNEGGMAETKEDAAYNWNSQKARADFKEAVSDVKRKQLPPQELERLAFFLLGEVLKKEGVIKGELD